MRYVVLGMHKSGTTLVARALHESGIIMGQDFPCDANYTEVKFEAREAQEITDEILGIPRSTLSLKVTSDALPQSIPAAISNKIRALSGELDKRYGDWGFKDPRCALTYRFWKQSLPEHRIIVVYRDPLEVWRRYARVNRKWWSPEAFRVWADYNGCILDSIHGVPSGDVIVLKFEALLNGNIEWDRLGKFVGREIRDVRVAGQSKFSMAGEARKGLRYRLLESLAGTDTWKAYADLEKMRQTTGVE